MGKRLTTNATTYKIYEVSIMGRKYVVKRLVKDLSDGTKGVYYYVYEQYRQGNKVVTKYIGKLDDIIEFFIKYRNSGMVDRPGFEPGTSRMPTERSSRLSYRPTYYSLYSRLLFRDYKGL